ncbi:unnamed protein product [Clavelina lepadiformis]|uniref:TLDc domain-containing protein n=1 Tax=Clavelina lepadiformis TaxID=159417 RepID=A0ABP0FZU6_CLALP
MKGMGGQHSYFGWWLSTEFGKGHSKGKKCTTYGSPQLSTSEDFKIDKLEAWAVGNKPQLEDESQENQSIIDKNPDAVAILRIAGKERHSEGLRESEVASSMPETTELHIAHDPME